MAEQKRKPAQEDFDGVDAAEDAVPTDGVVENPEIDVDYNLPSKKEEESSGVDSRTAQTIGRMVAGATPTLFGMLFGPQQAERGIAQTQKFGAAGKPSKLVPIVGPDGSPIYETPEGAVGEKVYQKPTKANTSSRLEKVDFVDPKQPGVVVKGYFNKSTGTYHKQSGEQVPDAQDPQKLNFERVKDQFGNERLVPLNPFTAEEGAKSKTLAEGIGSKPKIPEYAVKQADETVKTHYQNIRPLDTLSRTIEGAMSNLNASNADSVAQAAGMFQTAKVVAQEKMTDADRQAVAGEASIFANLAGEFDKATTNEQRQNVVSQMRGILYRMKGINDRAMEEYRARAVVGYAGNDENKAKYILERLKTPSFYESKLPQEQIQGKVINKTLQTKQKPKLTKQQWEALPEAKKRQLMGIK